MKVVITAVTEKGDHSSPQEVAETFREAMRIAKKANGKIVYGRGFFDGTEVILEK